MEIAYTLRKLEKTNTGPRLSNVIIAGDFNAPAGDKVYRMLKHDFADTFDDAGSGWGNTFHRSFPILRIDHIFASRSFQAIRSKAVTVTESDHRMVISDLLIK